MNYEHIKYEAARPLDSLKQNWADRDLERNARAEAHEMFQQWVEGLDQIMKGKSFSIIVPKPRNLFITVYPGCESKYNSQSLREYRNKHFKELIENYKRNVSDV